MKTEKNIMTIKRLHRSELVKVFALLLCIVNCLIVIVMLNGIIPFPNANVLSFGSLESYLNVAFVLLALPVISSAAAIASMFMKKTTPQIQDTPNISEVEPQTLTIEEAPKKEAPEEQYGTLQLTTTNDDKLERLTETSEKTIENIKMSIACPNCGKIIREPSAMLDFRNGTLVLEDICPFCSVVLCKEPDT